MSTLRTWATAFSCAVLAAATLRAQAPAPGAVLPAMPLAIDLTVHVGTSPKQGAARQRELLEWIKAYRKFQAWNDVWHNYVYDFGRRKQPPAPPDWLEDACTGLDRIDLYLPDDGFDRNSYVSVGQTAPRLSPMQTGCLLLEQAQDDDGTAQIRRQIRMGRMYADKPRPHTVIWELLNVDVMYASTSVGSTIRAPIGVHIGFPIGSRVRLFAAPGAILLCDAGFSDCHPAYDYGVGVRLFDFRMPRSRRIASAHVNLVKAWFFGGAAGGPDTGINIAGFSLAFKRR
jgi:hypothetical protein